MSLDQKYELNEGKHTMQPRLSIVIVNWNTSELLHNCLASLLSASDGLSVQIIVVDNNSSDDSVEMCGKYFHGVVVIRNSINYGYGQASNLGILASTAKYVLLLNSDTIVFPCSLVKLLNRIDEDDCIGVVGCRLLNEDSSYQPTAMRFPTLTSVFIERLLFYKLLPFVSRTPVEPPFLTSVTQCDWVSGACMMLRKKMLDSVGMFDQKIWMYGEEMELCFRIAAAGWKIVIDPSISVKHLGSGSWKHGTYSSTFFKTVGLLYFFRKHHSIWSYCSVYMLSATGAAIRIAIWAVLCLFPLQIRKRAFTELKTNMRLLAMLCSCRMRMEI